MKRKILIILFAVAAAICCAFAFTACGEEEKPKTPVYKTVSFDLQYDTNEKIADKQYEVGAKLTDLPKPVREDYDFLYWYVKSDPTSSSGVQKYTEDTLMPDRDLQLKACWEAKGFNTQYMTNGNEVKVLSVKDKTAESYVVPEGVTRIGRACFSGCENAVSITLPQSLTSFDELAFWNCTKLKNITFPAGITEFGERLFDGCSNLEEVTFATTSKFTEIPALMFTGCTSLSEITVPDSVTKIGRVAFLDCVSLEKVTLGNKVAELGGSVFSNCTNLAEINIPASLTTIGSDAFSYCTNLAKINIADIAAWCNVDIGGTSANPITNMHVFYVDGEPVTDLVIPEGVTVIKKSVFDGCTMLTKVTIPAGVTEIGANAFKDCYNIAEVVNLSSLEIKAGETANGGVSAYALEVVTSADKSKMETTNDDFIFRVNGNDIVLVGYKGDEKELVLPATYGGETYRINKYAFTNNDNITSLTVSDGVTSIGDYAFSNCKNLKSVTIGNGTTTIGGYAFSNCLNLMTLKLGNKISTIQHNAFNESNRLVEVINTSKFDFLNTGWVIAPNILRYTTTNSGSILETTDDGFVFIESDSGYDYIVNYVGEGGDVTLPENYNGIDYKVNAYAFCKISNITSLTIDGGMMAAGKYAFYGCSIKKVYISDLSYWCGIDFDYYEFNSNPISNELYLDGVLVEDLVIPADVTMITDYAFCWCRSLKSITLPDGLTTIGKEAFAGCTNLDTINLPDGITSIGYHAFNGSAYSKNKDNWTDGILYINNYLVEADKLPEAPVTIKDGTVLICERAFQTSRSITAVTFPETLLYIGESAFDSCKKLETIVIPDSVISIGQMAFYECNKITNVTIGSGVTFIGRLAIPARFGITTIDFKNKVGWWYTIGTTVVNVSESELTGNVSGLIFYYDLYRG